MIIYHDPDKWVSEVEREICDFHKKHPRTDFAGCTCFGSYTFRLATPQEYRRNRSARLKKEHETLTERLRQIEFEMGNKPQ